MRFIIHCLLLFFISVNALAADRYWVATGASNWNNTNNWSTTIGGTGGASVPTSADIAIFQSVHHNCDIDATVQVAGIRILAYIGTIAQNAFGITVGASGYLQNTGTFQGGTNTLTINSTGTFTLNGGIFVAPSNTFTITGTRGSSQTLFSQGGGTFSHNNGTFHINPNTSSCSQLTFTLDILTGTLFYNVVINGTPSCGINAIIATAGSDIITAINDLTHTDGNITGQFAVRNNLIVQSGADGGIGAITINGTGAQTYQASSARTCGITVDKSAGTFSPAVGTTDFSVQYFLLQQGIFTAPTGILNIGGVWNVSKTLFAQNGGSFVHNNGTLSINPNTSSCSQLTFTLDILPATQFYN